MKKCPYCYEEIQVEAKKCKHCYEMLTETKSDSSFLNFLNSSKDKIIEKYADYKQKQNSHLRLPTNEESWIIGDTHFFLNELVVEELGSVEYNRITKLYFSAKTITRSLISERKILFGIAAYLIDENDELTENISELPLISRNFKFINLDKKAYEITLMIYDHISKLTFYNRLDFYRKQIETNGYFDYMDYKFNKNGEIINCKNKIVADLSKLNINDVTFSSNWSGLKSYQDNPYEFRIINGLPQVNLFFGLFQTGHNFILDTFCDNDIFNLMIFNYINNKTYII
jgi:hypothetical protein